MVLAAEFDADPATERRAARPDIDRHVEHTALRHAHQLALRMRCALEVQPAQYASARARMVVLHERDALAGRLVEGALVVALHEEAACVAEHLRLQNQHAVYRGLGRFQRHRERLSQNTRLLTTRIRYWP